MGVCIVCVSGCVYVCMCMLVYVYICEYVWIYVYAHINNQSGVTAAGHKYLKQQQNFLPGSIALRTSCYQFPGTPHEGVRMTQHNCRVTVGNIRI